MKAGVLEIDIQRQNDDGDEIFWAQAMHHRARRLDYLEFRERRRLNQNDDNMKLEDGMDWRLANPYTTSLLSGRRLKEAVKLGLSNCHQVLWTGDIQIGTPSQTSTVHFDTGGSDLWVASKGCDESCDSTLNGGATLYDSTVSSTYEDVEDDQKPFGVFYGPDVLVKGEYGKDALSFGTDKSMSIPNAVFGKVTTLSGFKTCAGESGVLGLGYSRTTRLHNHPSPLKLLSEKLRNPMFALHLNPDSDYTKYSTKARSANSQVVMGGLNLSHYTGCMKWHALANHDKNGSKFNGYWDFKMDNVRTEKSSLSESHLAVVDSGSTYVVGPAMDVGKYCKENHAMCFQLNSDGNMDKDSNVSCDNWQGFDVAVVPCEADVSDLIFQADGMTYKLGKKELVMSVDTSHGVLCVLKVNGSAMLPGWVLGDPFLMKYYTAYDFGQQRVGVAISTKNSATTDTCEADSHLDINAQNEGSQNGSIDLDKITPVESVSSDSEPEQEPVETPDPEKESSTSTDEQSAGTDEQPTSTDGQSTNQGPGEVETIIVKDPPVPETVTPDLPKTNDPPTIVVNKDGTVNNGLNDIAENSSGGGLNAGAAAGIAICSLGLVLLALFAYRKRRYSRKMKSYEESDSLANDQYSDLEDSSTFSLSNVLNVTDRGMI